MVKIAVTGGIACGKSLLGIMLLSRGTPVCDADDLAHRELRKGTDSHRKIVRIFGAGVLDDEGEIKRGKLAAIVFRDKSALAGLNRIIHPPVGRAWRKWVREQSGGRVPAVAIIIPLLFEVGEDRHFDKVVCLVSSRKNQIARLRKRKMSESDAVARISAQMPIERKCDLADYVIVNDGNRKVLEDQLNKVMESILEK